MTVSIKDNVLGRQTLYIITNKKKKGGGKYENNK